MYKWRDKPMILMNILKCRENAAYGEKECWKEGQRYQLFL